MARQLNLPPSFVLIHRVSTAGIGVLCQLECEGPFRSEVLAWMPGYGPMLDDTGEVTAPDGPTGLNGPTGLRRADGPRRPDGAG